MERKVITIIGEQISTTYKQSWILLLLFLVLVILSCESNDKYYRPNLPEKLCSIGIIDVDDSTLRHISFEKSFQSEYPDEVNDSLRNFSFLISSSSGVLFNYHSDSTIKKINDLRIPDSISFSPGEKYYLNAEEKGLQEISAEVISTEPPAKPELISVHKENSVLSKPIGCWEDTTARAVIMNFSFNRDQDKYYAILVEGWGFTLSSTFIGWPGFLDFSITDSNAPGFFAEMHGLKTYHYVCPERYITIEKSPAYAYFIEGSKINDPKCFITMYIQYWDGYSPYNGFKEIGIKLLSIPKELYHFEKSLYTYKRTREDPFAEPIYLDGNIKGGNGIFALCRSTEIKITFSPWI